MLFFIGNMFFILMTFADYTLISLISYLSLTFLGASICFSRFVKFSYGEQEWDNNNDMNDDYKKLVTEYAIFLHDLWEYIRNLIGYHLSQTKWSRWVKNMIYAIILAFVFNKITLFSIIWIFFVSLFILFPIYKFRQREVEKSYEKINAKINEKIIPRIPPFFLNLLKKMF